MSAKNDKKIQKDQNSKSPSSSDIEEKNNPEDR